VVETVETAARKSREKCVHVSVCVCVCVCARARACVHPHTIVTEIRRRRTEIVNVYSDVYMGQYDYMGTHVSNAFCAAI